jgi:hypothetical protein
MQVKKGEMVKIGFTTYLAKGKLERFNKTNTFVKNVREVIRGSHILLQEDKFTKEKLKKLYPQIKWKYNPFELVRATCLIDPKDYVIIMDILEERTGKIWELDKVILMLIKRFIEEYDEKPLIEDKKNLKKFEKVFKKYYKNIMGSWKES